MFISLKSYIIVADSKAIADIMGSKKIELNLNKIYIARKLI